jgi:HEPN domain-containing protein
LTNTQERKFLPSYAFELLRIAASDLESAEILQASKKGRKENIFYHIQQSCEKSLKAALVSLELPVPLILDLAALVAKLPDSVERPFGYELGELTQFATIRRYEEGEMILTAEEAAQGILLAKTILAWSMKISTKATPP